MLCWSSSWNLFLMYHEERASERKNRLHIDESSFPFYKTLPNHPPIRSALVPWRSINIRQQLPRLHHLHLPLPPLTNHLNLRTQIHKHLPAPSTRI